MSEVKVCDEYVARVRSYVTAQPRAHEPCQSHFEVLLAALDQLQERLARSEAALRRIAAGGLFQPESFIKVAAEALAAADGKQQDCEHRSTHPGMPKDQPCHYCDGTATVAIQQDGGEA